MKKINMLSKVLLLLSVVTYLSSCKKEEDTIINNSNKYDGISLLDGEQSDFIVRGASGNKIVLDRTWYRNCIPTAVPNVWSSSQRTLSANELATTELLYGSSDCTSDLVMISVTVSKLELQATPTPISWVEMDGATPSAPPTGLENVTEANSIKFTIATATMTPVTAAYANILNTTPELGFGLTDWTAGVTKDVQAILSQFSNPGSATIIVLDNIGEGCVYDGIPDFNSTEEFPSKIGNIPHCGPLHSI